MTWRKALRIQLSELDHDRHEKQAEVINKRTLTFCSLNKKTKFEVEDGGSKMFCFPVLCASGCLVISQVVKLFFSRGFEAAPPVTPGTVEGARARATSRGLTSPFFLFDSKKECSESKNALLRLVPLFRKSSKHVI